MPYLSSTMPSKIFYASLGAEVLRIAKPATKIRKFKLSCAKIIFRMVKTEVPKA